MRSRWMRMAAVGWIPAALSGCVLAAAAVVGGAAAGTYLYVKGEMIQEYNGTVARAWNASLRTCERLQYEAPRGDAPDNYGGTLYSRRPADGAKITIKIAAKGPSRTQVGVRFGEFGDEALSKEFHTVLASEIGAR
jgi:hypothetical protein